MVGVRVLGALEAEVRGEVADLGGPRQRGVLELLLVARGDVVPVDRMIDDLWRGEPPPRAIGALQAYVSNLRRVLEPDRPPRAPARLLVSVPPGYAIRLPADAVDGWRFEALVRRAAGEPAAAARATLEQALGLWRGAAYAAVADEPWAVSEAARLEELRRVARERLVDAALRAGSAAEAASEAEVLTREQPLREEGWRLLALARYTAGQQADALAALRDARRTLADELGLDPGPALAALEADVLAHRIPLPPAPPVPAPAPPPAAPVPDDVPGAFVGREEELNALHEAARRAGAGGAQVALVAGDPGAGKSALLDRFRRELAAAGWRTPLGRCPEADGAPPAWAWVEALRALALDVDPGEHAAALAPLLDDAAADREPGAAFGRFRLHRAVAGWLAAGDRPLAVTLDDLHRADDETLALLRSLVAELSGRTGTRVLLVAAYRPADAGPRLEETLGALAPHDPARVRLDGLDESQAARLVRHVAGAQPDPAVLTALVERTGGNPFYLRESARLLASEGELVATSEVPEGVRDVLRRRFARLPELAVAVLRLAAVTGREVDVDVLLEAAEVDEESVLDALEAGLLAGLLAETGDSSRSVRFTHTLVRETLYGDISRLRRSRWHARVAEALERIRPADRTALAHHHTLAASPATARRAAEHAVAAAGPAQARYAHDAAIALYRQAAANLDRVPGGVTDDERVAVLVGLLRAQIAADDVIGARATRQQAIGIAAAAGRDDLLADTLAAWDVPTPWIVRSYGVVDEQVVAPLERLLAGHPLTDEQRCLLLCTLVREVAGDDDARAEPAAREALEIARRLGEPRLVGLALVELGLVGDPDGRAEERERHARELVELGDRHRLPEYALLGHHHLMVVAGIAADLPRLRAHLAEAETLAERYGFGQAVATLTMVHGMLEHAAGRLEAAERIYRGVHRELVRHGAMDADGVLGVALITVAVTGGRLTAMLPELRHLYERHGAPAADAYALALLEDGRPEEARRVRAASAGVPIRRDFFRVLMLALRAMAVVALAERDTAAALYDELRTVRSRVAGMSTASYTLRPVGSVLGDLARLLGRPEEAAAHYADGLDVARACGSPVWEADARAGLESVASRSQADH